MLWSELHEIENDGALWEIPGNRTKNKQTHLVPLSPARSANLSKGYRG